MDLTTLMAGIEEKKVGSRYRLVIVTAQRARQLMQGSRPLIPSKFSKEITIALEEVLEGKVEHLTGEEARTALKEARLKEATPERKVRSRTVPLLRLLSLVLIKAPPLPGLTCWKVIMTKGSESNSILAPARNSFVEIISSSPR